MAPRSDVVRSARLSAAPPPTYAETSARLGGRNTDGNAGPGGASATGGSSMRMLSSLAARGAGGVSQGMSDALLAWT